MNKENEQSEFLVTARKWRPLKFKDIVGQEHISITIQNAIINKKIHHAFLFSGPRGVGKTTTARVLARALNCLNPDGAEPCNECESCLSILEGKSMDVIEIDGASNNSVDDIRKLRENAKYTPMGKYKMYIIDEVHMLSNSAFNALLKTLEEPPPHLIFVFATTEIHKVPATILSRCQRFGFRRMEMESIIRQLGFIAHQEDISIDEESLVVIAKKADGSMRDAQSIFDQVIAFCGNTIKYSDMAEALHIIDLDFFFVVSKAVYEHNKAKMFDIVQEIVFKGYEYQECLHGILEHFRNIMTIKVTGKTFLIQTSSTYIDKYQEETEHFTNADLLNILTIIAQAEQALRFSPQPRVRMELALLQLASLDSAANIGELISEIKDLKKKELTDTRLELSSSQNKTAPVPAVKNIPQQQVKPSNYNNYSRPANPVEIVADTFDTKPQESIKQTVQSNSISSKNTVPINSQVLKSGWNKFIERHCNYANGLYILHQNDTCQVSFTNNEVYIKINNNFATEKLITKQEELEDALQIFYGIKVKANIIFDDTFELSESKNDDFASNAGNAIDRTKKDEYNKELVSVTSNSILNSENSDANMAKYNYPAEREIIRIFQAQTISNGN
jgi:DNA polymerase III subunit gamma/tau